MSRKAWSPPEGVEIDWTRPALHIARECGISTPVVTKWMRKQGLPVRPRGTPPGTTWVRANRLDPASLDWTRQDTALGKIYGVCRERIRQLRKAAGLPASGSAAWLAAGGVVTNPPHQGRKSKLAVDRQPSPA